MSRKLAWCFVGGAVLLLLAATLVLWLQRGPLRPHSETERRNDGTGSEEAAEEQEATVSARIYFPGAGGRLYAEARQLPAVSEPERTAAAVVEALLRGPSTQSHRPPLPEDVEVGAIDLSDDGILYVDLRSVLHPDPPVSGSRSEMLSLFSLVNSLVENVAGTRAVVVLWNGRQPATFGGHIDTSHPVLPRTGLQAS